jgi:ribose transport system permease protein
MIKNQEMDSLQGKAPRLIGNRLRLSTNNLLLLTIFAVIFAFFSIFGSNFFTIRSVLELLVQTSTFTILAIGSATVLVVGCIDFSLGAVIALSGTAVVVLAAGGLPIWLSMITATAVCGIIGLINGFLIAGMRLPSFVITFAVAMLLYGLLSAFGAFLNAYAGPIPNLENLSRLGDLARTPVFQIVSRNANGEEITVFPGISWIVVIMFIVAVLSQMVLKNTRYGRQAFLVGSNPEASRLSGIKVVRVKILAFVFASIMAGLVGVLLASRLGGAPGGAVGYEMIGIECAMIGGASLAGGTGSIVGTVIGSFILSTISMGLSMTDANHLSLPTLLNGIILLGIVSLDWVRNKR